MEDLENYDAVAMEAWYWHCSIRHLGRLRHCYERAGGAYYNKY